MGDLATHERAGAGHQGAEAAHEQDAATPATMAHTMIARGRRSPDDHAALLRRYPTAQREILTLLQGTLGNRFVQAVMSLFHGASAPAHDAAPADGDHAQAPPAAALAAPIKPAGSGKAARIPLGTVRVTANGLRIRRTPDTSSQENILGGLHHHAHAEAIAYEGDWLKIEHAEGPAFIHSDYVEAVAPKPIADAHPAVAPEGKIEPLALPKPDGGPVEIKPEAQAKPDAGHAEVKPDAKPEAQIKAEPITTAPTPTPQTKVDATTKPDATAQVKQDAPPPPPTAVADKHVAPTTDPAKTPEPTAPPQPDAQPKGSAEMFARVYTTSVGGKACHTQVFVTPGGVTATPKVAVYFHGFEAQYNIGDKGAGTLSGIDVAAQATAEARNKNTVVILPQGNIGRNAEAGGHMKVLEAGLPAFLSSILTPLAADLHLDGLTPSAISLSGHSAGGYEGMAHALAGAGSALDAITDVTLMDSDYAEVHYREAVKWMFAGKGGGPVKNLRIIEQASQLAPTQKRKPTDDPKKKLHVNYHDQFFQPAALEHIAKTHGCTVEHLHLEGKDAADVRAQTNTVVQRSRVLKDGAPIADLLIIRSSLTHQPLRDSVLDDQIDSIGEGSAGNDSFGTNETVVKDALKQARTQGASSTVAPTTTEEPKKHEPPKTPAKPKAEAHVDPAPTADPAKAMADLTPAKGAPSGAPKADHSHKGYDSDKNGLDSYGNSTERSWSKAKNSIEANKHVFVNAFTAIEDTSMYQAASGKAKHPDKLAKGSVVHVGDVSSSRVQIITETIKATDNVWVDFSALGGHGAEVGFGNEATDAADKERADAIRAGLPAGRKPGQSKFKWHFGSGFHPALDGVALDGSLMAKVHALMEWAIQNDMVRGDIVIGSGMRSPKDAHFMCVRYEIAINGMKNVKMEDLQALKGGKDADGNKWYEPGWTKDQVIEHAKSLYGKGSKGAVAAAGYNHGDPRRAPLAIGSGPGVSRHCSGHAVDVDIPWRSEKDPNGTDVWAWEQVYHQFGLTRPLHRDHGRAKSTQESWHIEETGKSIHFTDE